MLQVNTIRTSLAALSRGSAAIGLPQPHLNRTALCEIPESEYDPTYLARRDDLRAHLHATARAKALRGAPLDGPGLADLVEALVAALNDQEFPTAGSMLEAFNQRLVMECSDAHAAALEALPLPVDEVQRSVRANRVTDFTKIRSISRAVDPNFIRDNDALCIAQVALLAPVAAFRGVVRSAVCHMLAYSAMMMTIMIIIIIIIRQ